MAIALASMQGMYEHVAASIDPTVSPDDQLYDFMIAHAEYFESHFWLVSATIVGYAGIARRELEHVEEFETCRMRYEQLLQRILLAGIRLGIFKTVDTKLTSLSIFQLLNISRWYRPGRVLGAVEIAARNFELITGGLRAGDPEFTCHERM